MNQKAFSSNQENESAVIEMIRDLAIIINTAIVYHSRHPVFKRAVSDRWDGLVQAVKANKGRVELVFSEDQVFFRGKPVEPGNAMFRKLTRAFNAKGVQGLAWQAGVEQSDLVGLVDAFNNEVRKGGTGLDEALHRRGIKNIREIRRSVANTQDADSENESSVSPAKTGKRGKGKPDSTGKSSRPVSSPPEKSEEKVYDLDFEQSSATDQQDASFAATSPDFQSGSASMPFSREDVAISQMRAQCHEVITDYEKGKTTKTQAAETLTARFKENLDHRVEEIRRETESKIRRLENIKDLVMEELEQRSLAAVVINPQLRILSMNQTARELLGRIDSLDRKSPLASFINSGADKENLEINGVYRQAHIIISEHKDEESGTILICLEPYE